MARSVWSGSLSFGMLNIPIKLYKKTGNTSGGDFRLINRETSNPVSYLKVDSVTGDELDNDQIIKGYDLGDGQMVPFEKEELDAVVPDKNKVMEIIGFVNVVDDEYRDSIYVIGSEDALAIQYSLLREGIARSGKLPIVKLVMGRSERYALIENARGVLSLTTLRWAEQVRDVDDVAPAGLDTAIQSLQPEHIDLMVKLIETNDTMLDVTELEDHNKQRVRDLVERKINDGIVEDVAEPEPTFVGGQSPDDILAVLQESLKQHQEKEATA